MKEKSAQQLGIEFQTRVQNVLSGLQSTNAMVYHRLYDTKSAGNFLPGQPGDFCGCWKGRAFLIEVKLSTKHTSLAGSRAPLNSLFDDEQVAKMRLWSMAKAQTLVIFKSHTDGAVEVWDGGYLGECYVTPKKKLEPIGILLCGSEAVLDNLPAVFDFYNLFLHDGADFNADLL